MAVAAPDRELGRLAFWVTGATIYLGWNATTLVGALGRVRWGDRAGRAGLRRPGGVPGAAVAATAGGAPEAAVHRRVALGCSRGAGPDAVRPGRRAGRAAVVAVAVAGPPRTRDVRA